MRPSTISGINLLPEPEKRAIYRGIIPAELRENLGLPESLKDPQGRDLVDLNAPPGSSTTEMSLYHQVGFPDPVLYGQITDTLSGQLHILMYVINDPQSPRYDVDRLPDGTKTNFGIVKRNLAAEESALRAGLAPGQVRHGLRLLRPAIRTFEAFVQELGHDLYFAEPLYYHNAILFEHYGFTYQQGRRRMQRIQEGFSPGGDLLAKLDGSTPFHQPGAENSIRLRSWAIHDGILDEPFTHVTMYKQIGKEAGVRTCPDCTW
jgi:hypothetical protein